MSYHSILRNWKLRILIGVLSAIIFKFSVDVLFGLMYKNYQVLKSIDTYFGVILTTLLIVECFNWIAKVLDKKTSWDDSPQKRFFLQLLFYSLVTLFAFGPFRWFIEFIFANDYFTVVMNELIILLASFMVTVIYNSIDLGLFLLFRWRESLAEIERFKKENAEFQFDMLRSQVNPHFLFNSLNTLSSLMYENVDLASDYIRKLSQVYRYVLENRQVELIDLKKEIDFIKSYKYMFELRFKNRLHIYIEIDEAETDKKIVPMTVQMLVENAVKHNVISQKYPLQIHIIAKDGWLKVNNSLKKKAPEGYSSGMGLHNIKSRYSFVSDKQIEIVETADNFEVTVPLIDKKE